VPPLLEHHQNGCRGTGREVDHAESECRANEGDRGRENSGRTSAPGGGGSRHGFPSGDNGEGAVDGAVEVPSTSAGQVGGDRRAVALLHRAPGLRRSG
jgi:hypothetical protein